MTARERLMKDWPHNVSPERFKFGGCLGCPSTYNYLADPDFCQDRTLPTSEKCNRCWDREIPETNKEENSMNTMTPNEYQRLALKTEAVKDPASLEYIHLARAMEELGIVNHYEDSMAMWRLLNAALGLPGEAGEVADMVKKAYFQGHELDKTHLAKELGDIAWYLALAADAIGYDLETIFKMNIDKLADRYPAGYFEAERSVNRKAGDV